MRQSGGAQRQVRWEGEVTANSFCVYSTDVSAWLHMLLRGGVLRHNENRTRVDTLREKKNLLCLETLFILCVSVCDALRHMGLTIKIRSQ